MPGRPSSAICYFATRSASSPIATLRVHLEYLREKAALWDARARSNDAAASAASPARPRT